MQNLAKQYANVAAAANLAATPTATAAAATPTIAATAANVAAATPTNVIGQTTLYNRIQAAKAAKAAKLAAAQAAQLAAATFVLVKPSKANLSRQKVGVTVQQQQQVNANLAATLILQLYPLVASGGVSGSGLTLQQQQQVQQHLLQSVYTLQQAAAIPANKQAVQLQLPPLG